jgi:hypothetical protein
MEGNQKNYGSFADAPKIVRVIQGQRRDRHPREDQEATERDLVSFLSLNTSFFPSF